MGRIHFRTLLLSCLRGPRPEQPQPPPPQLPPFLQLPVDIVLYLSQQHLTPSSASALSLTCRALFALVFPAARSGLADNKEQTQELQLLLEKDLGHGWWYCHGCSLLHPISSRGPGGGADSLLSASSGYDSARRHHNKRWFAGSSFGLDYQSVRLAMNRHFWGPPNGLPLEAFNIETKPYSSVPVVLPWKETWSARILQDELFLCATRTLSGRGWADQQLRTAMDGEWRQICCHIATSRRGLCSIDILPRPSPARGEFFVPCRELVDSCRGCLTDYAVTVEPRLEAAHDQNWGEQPTAYWFIAITSYYRLGSGRSHLDPKWDAFGGGGWQAKRDMVAYPRGAIRAVWESEDPTPSSTY